MSEHNARRWNVSNDEYHAEHGVYGNSMLSCFRESPILFHGRFITGEIPPRERTPALTFGSNFDRVGTLRQKLESSNGNWHDEQAHTEKV